MSTRTLFCHEPPSSLLIQIDNFVRNSFESGPEKKRCPVTSDRTVDPWQPFTGCGSSRTNPMLSKLCPWSLLIAWIRTWLMNGLARDLALTSTEPFVSCTAEFSLIIKSFHRLETAPNRHVSPSSSLSMRCPCTMLLMKSPRILPWYDGTMTRPEASWIEEGGPVPTHLHESSVTLSINRGLDQVCPSSSLYIDHTSVLFRVCGSKILPDPRSCTGAALPTTVEGRPSPLSERTTRSEDHVEPWSRDDLTTMSVQAKSLHECILASAKARRVPLAVRRREGIFMQ
mmetsp:Transcript_13032/g.24952  ORF Transcript_13032/g.24952 Transcript_13032/m.24952 type:complete len:285 (+) Transcript_13032:289-1143(+)